MYVLMIVVAIVLRTSAQKKPEFARPTVSDVIAKGVRVMYESGSASSTASVSLRQKR
jgi:hypothetical protein